MIIMRHQISVSLLLIVVALLAIGIFPGVAAMAEEVILGSGTWVPFTGKDLPEQGTTTKLVKEAFSKVGITVKRVEMPWARVLKSVGNDIDGGYPLGRSPEREEIFHFSDKIGSATRYIYHLKTKPFEWKKVDDLKGLKIGIVRGAKFGPVHEELLKNIDRDPTFAKIEEVTNDVQNFRKLFAGRIEIVFCEANQTQSLLQQLNLQDQIVHHPFPIMESKSLFVVFPRSPRGKYLRGQLNLGLKLLQVPGE